MLRLINVIATCVQVCGQVLRQMIVLSIQNSCLGRQCAQRLMCDCEMVIVNTKLSALVQSCVVGPAAVMCPCFYETFVM